MHFAHEILCWIFPFGPFIEWYQNADAHCCGYFSPDQIFHKCVSQFEKPIGEAIQKEQLTKKLSN